MCCNVLAKAERVAHPKGDLGCFLFRHGSPSAIANGGIVPCCRSQDNATPSAHASLLPVIKDLRSAAPYEYFVEKFKRDCLVSCASRWRGHCLQAAQRLSDQQQSLPQQPIRTATTPTVQRGSKTAVWCNSRSTPPARRRGAPPRSEKPSAGCCSKPTVRYRTRLPLRQIQFQRRASPRYRNEAPQTPPRVPPSLARHRRPFCRPARRTHRSRKP